MPRSLMKYLHNRFVINGACLRSCLLACSLFDCLSVKELAGMCNAATVFMWVLVHMHNIKKTGIHGQYKNTVP